MLGLTDWQRAISPAPLQDAVIQWASMRKRRLLLVGICRRVAHLMTEERLRWLGEKMVEEPLTPEMMHALFPSLFGTFDVVERYADGLASDEELGRHNREWGLLKMSAWSRSGHTTYADPPEPALICAISKAMDEASHFNMTARELSYVSGNSAHAAYLCNGGTEPSGRDPTEEAAQCDLIRDVVQHPDLAATIAPMWKTETVVSLARGIYDQRAFDRMPILADALEEAGCDDQTILRHCRADAPHVRGCWVVDQVLGLE